MTEYEESMRWQKFMRRHQANVFNAFFYDKENVSSDDVDRIITDIASFFGVSTPEVNTCCETCANIVIGDSKNNNCEMSYNMQMLGSAGINNTDAFILCFVHEMAHKVLHKVNFMLFKNERWVQELAADLVVGIYADNHGLATGKYKYAVSNEKSCVTHPDGRIRVEVIDYGRKYFEKVNRKVIDYVSETIKIMPAFIYGHYIQLLDDWEKVVYDVMHINDVTHEKYRSDIMELPDDNLIKQAVIKIYKQRKMK